MTASTPQDRIDAFLLDYEAQWVIAQPHFDGDDGDGFATWIPQLAALEDRHANPGAQLLAARFPARRSSARQAS